MTTAWQITLIIVAWLFNAGLRVLAGLKNGLFYLARRQGNAETTIPVPPALKRFYSTKANIHYVESPRWYWAFMAFFCPLCEIFYLLHPGNHLWNITAAILIVHSASAVAGPFYQGYINLGSGKPFVDKNENSAMELASAGTGKTLWVKRFWRGPMRIVCAVLAIPELILGLLLIFYI